MIISVKERQDKTSIKSFIQNIWNFIRLIMVLLLVIISIMMIYNSKEKRLKQNYFNETKLKLSGFSLNIFDEIYNVTSKYLYKLYNNIIDPPDLASKNEELSLELSRLKKILTKKALLQEENLYLKEMLSFNIEKKIDYDNFLTAKILALEITPFSSKIIINSGKKDSLNINDVAFYKDILIGKISLLSKNHAKITLIDDPSSRIPVINENSKEKAVFVNKDNQMQLIYYPKIHHMKIGDYIYSSQSKIYPHGLKIAVITKITEEQILLKPIYDINHLKYIHIKINNLLKSNI